MIRDMTSPDRRAPAFISTAVALLWGIVAVVAGCSSGTEPGTPPVALLGTWIYEGEQISPMPAALTGELEIASQSGDRLEGSIDVLEVGGVESRRLTGLVSGIALDAATVDFDVHVEGSTRRHVGEVRGDTIEGAWADVVSGGGSGSFRAVRENTP